MRLQKSKYAKSDLSAVYSGSDSKSLSIRPAEIVDVYNFPDDKYVKMRLFGDMISIPTYWVETPPNKKGQVKMTSFGKPVSFAMGCCSWDWDTFSRDFQKEDPWRDFEQFERSTGIARKDQKVQFRTEVYMNAIIRSIQDDEPSSLKDWTDAEAETGCKEKDSDSWTPVRVVKLPYTLVDQIRNFKSQNTYRDEEGRIHAYDIYDPKYGVDVTIYKDSKAKGQGIYKINFGSNTPLTKAERNYLEYDLDLLHKEFTAEEITPEFNQWIKRMGYTRSENSEGEPIFIKNDNTDGEDFESEAPAKRTRARQMADDYDDDEGFEDSKPAKKRHPVADDFDDAEGLDEKPVKKQRPVADDDEEEAPVRKRRPSADDFDEDEDEAPRKKVAKKRPVDDDFEEDDEPKRKPVKKAKPDMSDDDFGDDDDDAPFDEPKRPAKKSRPSDDDFDDDDFEEEKPAKKRRPSEDDDEDEKPRKKVAKKVAPADDDFDDFDDEDF